MIIILQILLTASWMGAFIFVHYISKAINELDERLKK